MPAADPTPAHSNAFGHAEHADDTRQAQHQVANDAPVDVNPNAIIARAQMLTFTVAGNNFEAGADRRRSLMDHFAAKLASV